jgi:hypothetical protein
MFFRIQQTTTLLSPASKPPKTNTKPTPTPNQPNSRGIIEVPSSADVGQLKRLLFYAAHNQLLPALQVGVGRGCVGCCRGVQHGSSQTKHDRHTLQKKHSTQIPPPQPHPTPFKRKPTTKRKQRLYTEDGVELADGGPGGAPLPLAAYGVGDGARLTLRVAVRLWLAVLCAAGCAFCSVNPVNVAPPPTTTHNQPSIQSYPNI